MTGCKVELNNGWCLYVTEGVDETWIIIGGPHGEGAAWSCNSGSVRAEVLQAFMRGQYPPHPSEGDSHG